MLLSYTSLLSGNSDRRPPKKKRDRPLGVIQSIRH